MIANFCTGVTDTLFSPGGSDFDYTWYLDDGYFSNDTMIFISQGGNYKLVMENYCGQDIAEKSIQVNLLPEVYLGEDVTLLPGESITLQVDGDYPSLIWNGIDSTSESITLTYESIYGTDTTITVVVKDDNSCENSDEVVIELFNVIVHSVLTPNGDGKNDLFLPDEKGWNGIHEHKMIVFNRWGEKVWESGDFASGWDGKQNGKYVANGSYFWVLEVFYGTDNLKKVYKGNLTVLGTDN